MRKKPRVARGPHEYATGFGKPPAHTRFKKGQSGNPSGRPKDATRLDSLLKAELDTMLHMKIDGESREISRREAIVRRVFTKALRGDLRALEIFVKHARKKDAAEPQAPWIIKYYKDDVRRLQATEDGERAGDAKDAASPSHDGGTSKATLRHVDRTTIRQAANPQADRSDQEVAELSDGTTSLCTDATIGGAQPHGACDHTKGEASSPGVTIRMRAQGPHHNFYVSARSPTAPAGTPLIPKVSLRTSTQITSHRCGAPVACLPEEKCLG